MGDVVHLTSLMMAEFPILSKLDKSTRESLYSNHKKINKGKKGSFCLSPLELWKNPVSSPLIQTEYERVEIHSLVQYTNIRGNSIILSIKSRKVQYKEL